MKFDKQQLTLYAITDRSWLNGNTLESDVEKSLQGGATFLQLREKELDDESFLQEAKVIKTLCDKYNVPFVINDNVEIAKLSNADGVHVGQDDMDLPEVRRILGNDKIIGVSAMTVEQAVLAEKQGADYLGVGAVFPTTTKGDADAVSFTILKEICDTVSIPVVAIGGIQKGNIMELAGTGISGISVVSAIYAQDDILSAAQELKVLAEKIVSL